MSQKDKLKNQDGMTLIEVLAAVVLLSIIFMVASSLFPQMNNMNARTGDKLDTMTEAETRVSAISKIDAGLYPLDFKRLGNLLPGMHGAKTERTPDGRILYTITKEDRIEELTIWEKPDEAGRASNGELGAAPALYRLKMKVSTDGGTSSAAYAYLEVDVP